MHRNWLVRLNKPEYFFNPMQFVRRLRRSSKTGPTRQIVQLPWKLKLDVDVQEVIGRSLWHLGIYDLLVSEVLWRLQDRGEDAVDVGANVGYTASILARRAGRGSVVTAFEPHPLTYRNLSRNVQLWSEDQDVAQVFPVSVAASSSSGMTRLCIPKNFESNTGLAFLAASSLRGDGEFEEVPVSTLTLDEYFQDKRAPRLMKLDVEGSEALVLQGARRLLRDGALRDIVFEDHKKYPSEPMQILEDAGYRVFLLRKTFLGPALMQPDARVTPSTWEPPNYLATRDPERAMERVSKIGWSVLRIRI